MELFPESKLKSKKAEKVRDILTQTNHSGYKEDFIQINETR